MTTKQWTIEDFEQNQPIYRVRRAELMLLGVATWPFTIGAIYWLGCVLLKPAVDSPAALMWISLLGGATVSAGVCIVVLEWLKAFHYKRIREGDDALRRCGMLLSEALRDKELVDKYLAGDLKQSIIRGLTTIGSNEDGVEVVRCDDEKVFMLVDQWIRKRAGKKHEAMQSFEIDTRNV